ncbi:hypothetical protein Esti_003298 [Eimeria stiedai]
MTSLQIQSFASLIDQLPIGVEESERIDQAASAASCSGRGAEEGCLDRALEIADRKHGVVSRRDCAKAACLECPQGVSPTAVGCPSDEVLTSGLVYGTTAGFPAVSFSATGEETPCMQPVHEASPASLAGGGCADPSSMGDGSLLAGPSSFYSEQSAAAQQQQAAAAAAASLRGFPPQEACAVVGGPGQVSFGPYCAEEASAPVFSGAPPPPGYSSLDLAAGRSSVVLGDQGCVGSAWPQWAQSCPSASDCKYTAAPVSRTCSERFSVPPSQSLRATQASHGGGQLQVSIVSPGEDVVVTSYGCSDWGGCCNGCQVEVTRVSRPSTPRHPSPVGARSRQTCSPANIKVKSVSPSGPDHFVLCLEGESGQEQHVSIDRQELLLVASAEVNALAEQRDNIKTPTGSRSAATKGGGMMYGVSCEEGQQEVKWVGSKGLLGGGPDGRCDKWNQDVDRWQHQMCRELELQKRRLQQREEACRQREEEFRLREDEARRQKLTIAALEGEVLKVTEEMQEILLQKEEGRLIVQREFLERKGRYVSRLQDLRPYLGNHFEDVLRGLTSCRTIGQLSTWSSVFDATEEMPPKVAAQRIIEVLRSGLTAPLFVPLTGASFVNSFPNTNVLGVAVDIVSRPSCGTGSLRCTAKGPLSADHCIVRIPSLTNDSYVRGDNADGDMALAGGTAGGHGFRGSNQEDPRFGAGNTHGGEQQPVSNRCRHQQTAAAAGAAAAHAAVDDSHARDTHVRGLRAGALWDASVDPVGFPLGSPVLDLTSAKDCMHGGPQYNVHAGQVVLPSSLSTELTMDGIYLRSFCSRLPSRTTSLCGEHDSSHPDWAPCRIDSRHAEEAFDTQGADACASWMERVAYANGGGSLSISFFNAAPRTHRTTSPICG